MKRPALDFRDRSGLITVKSQNSDPVYTDLLVYLVGQATVEIVLSDLLKCCIGMSAAYVGITYFGNV